MVTCKIFCKSFKAMVIAGVSSWYDEQDYVERHALLKVIFVIVYLTSVNTLNKLHIST